MADRSATETKTDAAALAHYSTPGMMTDLRSCIQASLPIHSSDAVSLCRLAQNLIVHEFLVGLYGVTIPESRRLEVHTRPATQIVEQILRLDPAPLTSARPPERRMIGNCRMFTTLSVALLRRNGIPARARCGFGGYFEAGKYIDHWVAEYWHADDARWVRFDSQIDPVLRGAMKIDFDSEDIPAGRFLTGGEAWEKCRADELDASDFGIDNMWGLWFIAGNVVRDLAALNKVELLPWDVWGMMPPPDALTGEAMPAFDRIAATIATDDLESMRALYEGDPSLKVPSEVLDARLGAQHPLD